MEIKPGKWENKKKDRRENREKKKHEKIVINPKKDIWKRNWEKEEISEKNIRNCGKNDRRELKNERRRWKEKIKENR